MGLGYFRPEAPIGFRYWASDKVGIDVGVGFDNVKPDKGTGSTSYLFDVGVPLVLKGGDNLHFFVRPGVAFSSNGGKDDATSFANAKVSSLFVSGSLGVEYFFSPAFSVQVAHGVLYQSQNVKYAPTVGPAIDETNTSFRSEDFGISNIGFHYYFGGK